MSNFNYVYRITEHSSGKHYIGVRKSRVLPELDLGTKYFTSSKLVRPIFQNNPRLFKIKIVSTHSTYEEAYRKEQKYLCRVGVPNDRFFNQTQFLGKFPLSQEAKEKQQRARIRNSKDPKWLQTMSLCRIGKPHPNKSHKQSEEAKQKLRAALTGVPKTPEHRQMLSEAHKGKRHSPETRRKMSLSQRVRRTRNANTRKLVYASQS